MDWAAVAAGCRLVLQLGLCAADTVAAAAAATVAATVTAAAARGFTKSSAKISGRGSIRIVVLLVSSTQGDGRSGGKRPQLNDNLNLGSGARPGIGQMRLGSTPKEPKKDWWFLRFFHGK